MLVRDALYISRYDRRDRRTRGEMDRELLTRIYRVGNVTSANRYQQQSRAKPWISRHDFVSIDSRFVEPAPRNERIRWKIAKCDLPHAHKVCCKSCRSRIIKVLRLIGGKTRPERNAKSGELSKSAASLADFTLITRGVGFVFLSLSAINYKLCLKHTERDRKLPSIRLNIFSCLVDEKKIRIVPWEHRKAWEFSRLPLILIKSSEEVYMGDFYYRLKILDK